MDDVRADVNLRRLLAARARLGHVINLLCSHPILLLDSEGGGLGGMGGGGVGRLMGAGGGVGVRGRGGRGEGFGQLAADVKH